MAGHRACGQNFGITGFSEYSRILLSRCLGWLKKLGCWQLSGETWACRDVEVLHKPEPFSYFHQPPSPCLLLSLCSTNTFCYQGAHFSLGSMPYCGSYNYHVNHVNHGIIGWEREQKVTLKTEKLSVQGWVLFFGLGWSNARENDAGVIVHWRVRAAHVLPGAAGDLAPGALPLWSATPV